ncbi:hypothetical protein ELI13_37995 [Rhizobium ruizarguesonis]|uniref:hypothetical protein n=1 Tax=Rhizobium ruizarguesonis TaxID=2081791 RepID=UPI00103014B8|nr:hypothetical protein [Rhizobium ruizarguesonis]TAU59268.1 hypothetical protein ELI46_38490 [Rhizobium ruizarguesonis]TAU59320.1 hypothetical protein ELI46_38315 [Rhizobium ruizarguesonis]TAU60954.1 hypothetical protein ELI46_34810 [Rhizobium ruizarguesonis]TAW47960.1 hypothetical protein ELI15_37555 [Rhizobium ruizarguesonis]TAW80985.1 hypothetical protein ELI13_37995 [Rhizobium ruizarguesonis]
MAEQKAGISKQLFLAAATILFSSGAAIAAERFFVCDRSVDEYETPDITGTVLGTMESGVPFLYDNSESSTDSTPHDAAAWKKVTYGFFHFGWVKANEVSECSPLINHSLDDLKEGYTYNRGLCSSDGIHEEAFDGNVLVIKHGTTSYNIPIPLLRDVVDADGPVEFRCAKSNCISEQDLLLGLHRLTRYDDNDCAGGDDHNAAATAFISTLTEKLHARNAP